MPGLDGLQISGGIGIGLGVPSQAPVPAWLYGDYGGSGGARVAAANCIAAYCPIGAGSYAASKSNLANPGTYDATDGTATPTFAAASGWTFAAASSQFLRTTLIPASGWSVLVRFSGVSGSNTNLLGSESADANGKFGILPNVSGPSHLYRYGTSTGLAISGGVTAGVLGFRGQTPNKNGVDEAGTIAGSLVNAVAMYIGCRNSSGSAAAFITASIQAIWVYNVILSAQQAAGLTGAMNALTSAGNYYL